MLPKIDIPLYNLTLPLLKKEVKFRPFLVKEEKILLMAVESEDEDSMLLAIKQIVNNCCITELDIDNLPMTDLEFIFLNLRARSISEIVELQYKCNNKVGGEEELIHTCDNLVKFSINILNIKPEIPKEHTTNIEISDNIGVMLKYPCFNTYKDLDKNKSEVDIMIDVLIKCIDYIYDDDTIYYSKDLEEGELQTFIEDLTQDQFKNIQNFFKTIPSIKTVIQFKCPKCGYEEKIDVVGIQNFLA
ncbi:gp26 family baseplate hub assembly chaperone [Candidatus Dojkabacteria bacterium]|jgi:hypothetical protein|nr:gp26 family baseplate hub assembly chaperone [Candidatus Dojkabacteria bacterium]